MEIKTENKQQKENVQLRLANYNKTVTTKQTLYDVK